MGTGPAHSGYRRVMDAHAREECERINARRDKPARRTHPPREDGSDSKGELAPQVPRPFKPVEWES